MSPIKSLACGLCAGALLLAQGPPAHFGHGGDAHLMGAAGLEGRIVKGAPYTAQVTTTSTQTLAGGNQITHTSSALLARDSEGRSRREQTVQAVGQWSTGRNPPAMVFIHDPVAQVSYTLQPNTKSAHKMTMHMPSGSATAAVHSARAAGHARRGNADANFVTESLGSKTIEGVQVDGQRFTRTIPAGQVGNAQPITIVKEVWTSAELHTVVMSHFSDPRSGDTTYTLTNIQRVEPDASLFTVPSGYSVTEGHSRGGR